MSLRCQLPLDALEGLRAECLARARARAMSGPDGLVQRDTFVYVTGDRT